MSQNGKIIFNRHSLRLRGYDYSKEGGYFVTLMTRHRFQLFGKVANGVMELNQYGKIVEEILMSLPDHIKGIQIDEFIVMPNHFHGIVIINDMVVGAGSKPARAGLGPAPTIGLSEIVRQLKTFSARRINQIRNMLGVPVWQCNYYDHIICSEKEYDDIVAYIYMNPLSWIIDREYSEEQ